MLKPILVVLTAAGMAGVALPHAKLKSSVPTKDASLTESPKTVSLTFSEGVVMSKTGISVLKADSSVVEQLMIKATAGDTTVAGPLTKPLVPGSYIIKWKNTSTDDDASTGVFAFKVVKK